jgi:hypothetical protein
MDNDRYTNRSSSTDVDTKNMSTGGQSQVASVGFNTLKKWNTSSTQFSGASTTSNKTNALSRLFTRNRSSTYITPQVELGLSILKNSEDEYFDTASSIEAKQSNKFRFLLNKFKISNRASRPDLKIQTSANINSTSITTKKQSNSTQTDENSFSLRRDSLSSPSSTLHNFFHRSQSITQINADLLSTNMDDLPISKRTVGLSSNNSNSIITDMNSALVYKFTYPDYSLEDTEGLGEHTSILDIHKKLLIPTDQYLLSKLNNRQQNQDIGLGILNETNEIESQIKLQDTGRSNSSFFDNLLEITRPIYLNQQKRTLNGLKQIYLAYTIEDIANFIRLNYFNSSVFLPLDSETASPSRRSRIRPKYSTRTFSSNSLSLSDLNLNSATNLDAYKLREISKDLTTYFCKGLNILRKDFDLANLRSDTSSHAKKVIDLNEWEKIIEIWDYFNRHIRYFILACFQPLQKYFHEISVTENINVIEIESILLVSFRDSILMSCLTKKLPRFREHGDMFTLEEEKKELAQNPKLLNRIIECLGVLCSSTGIDAMEDCPISDFMVKILEGLLNFRRVQGY